VNNPPQEKIIPLEPFQTGQIWQMENSNVRIGDVGKTLVEYKLLDGRLNRGRNHLIAKLALQDFLKLNRAILVR